MRLAGINFGNLRVLAAEKWIVENFSPDHVPGKVLFGSNFDSQMEFI